MIKRRIYKAEDGWRWQDVNIGNHKIEGASTEAYDNHADCVENATKYLRADIEEVDDEVSE